MSFLKPKIPGSKPKSLPSSPAFRRRKNEKFLSFRGRGNGKKKDELEKKSQSNPSSPKGIFRLKGQETFDNLPTPPPLQPTTILVSPTDDEVESILHSELTQSEPLKSPSQSQLLAVQGTPKIRSSVVSVDSGYGTDGSRSNLLNEGKSTSDLQDSSESTQESPQSRTKPKSLKDTNDKHPNRIFHVTQCPSMCSLSENEPTCPLDAENRQPTSEVTSPTESETSTISPNEQPLHHCFRRKTSLTRTPSGKARRLSNGTKIYKDIPRKYQTDRPRRMSQIYWSELYSDDEDSVNSPLRRLRISVSKSRRQSIDEGTEYPFKPEPLKSPEIPMQSTPKSTVTTSQESGMVSIDRLECKSESFPCFSTMQTIAGLNEAAMHQWFQEQVREMEKKMDERIQAVEKGYEEKMRVIEDELKDRFSALQDELRRTCSDPAISSQSYSSLPSQVSSRLSQQFSVSTESLEIQFIISQGERNRSFSESRSNSPPMRRSSTRLSCSLLPAQEVQSTKLPHELPQEQVSDKAILKLSKILPLWQWPARGLGLNETEIECIRIDYPGDSREQSYQMLRKWKQMYPENADYLVLGNALKDNTDIYPKFVEIVLGST